MYFLKESLELLDEREDTGDDHGSEERVFKQWYAYSLELAKA